MTATDDEALAAESAQLDQLLDDIHGLVPLPVWNRIAEVLRRIVRLYGAGIARSLAHARATGANPEALDARLVDDQLVASLLVLHGLHPVPAEARVRRAVDAVADELGIPGRLAFVEIRGEVVHLEARDAGAVSPGLLESVVRRAIEAAAPEVMSVAIEGLRPTRDPTLVQLRTRRAP